MEYFLEYKAVAILLKTIPLILLPKVSDLNALSWAFPAVRNTVYGRKHCRHLFISKLLPGKKVLKNKTANAETHKRGMNIIAELFNLRLSDLCSPAVKPSLSGGEWQI